MQSKNGGLSTRERLSRANKHSTLDSHDKHEMEALVQRTLALKVGHIECFLTVDQHLFPQKEAKEREAAKEAALRVAEQPPVSINTEYETLETSKLEETLPVPSVKSKEDTCPKPLKVKSIFDAIGDGKCNAHWLVAGAC